MLGHPVPVPARGIAGPPAPEPSEFLLQIHHIDELFAAVEDRVVVMIDKEVFDAVGDGKPAPLVEPEDTGAVARADEHDAAPARVVLEDAFDKPLAVALSPELFIRGDVLQFINAVAFAGHHADTLKIAVIEGKEIPAIEVGLDHGFLLIPDQQQVKEPSPVVPNEFDLHGLPGWNVVLRKKGSVEILFWSSSLSR